MVEQLCNFPPTSKQKIQPLSLVDVDCLLDIFSGLEGTSNFLFLPLTRSSLCHIESVVENGICVFKLSELHSLYDGYLHDLRVDKAINRTRLKIQLHDYFFGDCQEQCDGKNVMLVFNEGFKKLLKESMDAQDYECQMLIMAKVVKFLSREILSSKSSPFTGSFLP